MNLDICEANVKMEEPLKEGDERKLNAMIMTLNMFISRSNQRVTVLQVVEERIMI